MTQQIKINKIELQIGSKKLSLSIEDAKLLQAVLNSVFKSSTIAELTPVEPSVLPFYYQITDACSTIKVNTDLDNSTGILCIKSED